MLTYYPVNLIFAKADLFGLSKQKIIKMLFVRKINGLKSGFGRFF